ncbi:hypothetical protein QUF64_10800 [Anaerolineales bacterium HSG6]|nr:hypothetical protein [Anaerolineales bacterium HSG6]
MPILIHAGKAWDAEFPKGRGVTEFFKEFARKEYGSDGIPMPDKFEQGGIVGYSFYHGYPESENYWANEGMFHWALRDGKSLPFVPWKGQVHCFKVDENKLPFELPFPIPF